MARPAASGIPNTARVDTVRARWDATVAELVRLRREEAAQEQAAEDALADELRRALGARPVADPHQSGAWIGGLW